MASILRVYMQMYVCIKVKNQQPFARLTRYIATLNLLPCFTITERETFGCWMMNGDLIPDGEWTECSIGGY